MQSVWRRIFAQAMSIGPISCLLVSRGLHNAVTRPITHAAAVEVARMQIARENQLAVLAMTTR
jgi:hypothetical protein